jgi:hypothetical protein
MEQGGSLPETYLSDLLSAATYNRHAAAGKGDRPAQEHHATTARLQVRGFAYKSKSRNRTTTSALERCRIETPDLEGDKIANGGKI